MIEVTLNASHTIVAVFRPKPKYRVIVVYVFGTRRQQFSTTLSGRENYLCGSFLRFMVITRLTIYIVTGRFTTKSVFEGVVNSSIVLEGVHVFE